MKATGWIKPVAANLFIALIILAPFMPGPYIKVVNWLSVFGQIAGTFGLLFVPAGLAWLIIVSKIFRRTGDSRTVAGWRYKLALSVALFIIMGLSLAAVFLPNPMPQLTMLSGMLLQLAGLILTLNQIKKLKRENRPVPYHGVLFIIYGSLVASFIFVYLFAALFVFVGAGVVPGILVLLLFPVGLFVAGKKSKKLSYEGSQSFSRAPYYFLTLPLTAFLTFMFLARPASGFSRSFAIKRSGALIALIEDYRNKTGGYPDAVNDLVPHTGKKIPKPFIMGIENFRYNKINDRYSISFSQWLDLGSLEEIVLYDKNNLRNNLPGEFLKYDYSFDLSRIKGAFASYEAGYGHWRYYHVD
jgi:hypothetical protein